MVFFNFMIMTRKLFFILLGLACSNLCFAQQLTTADYLEDLQYLRDTLPQRHINLFAKVSRADFNQKIDAMASLLMNMDREAFITELFKLPVAIGDEHTHIEATFTRMFPIRFEKFSEGVFVTATDSANTDLELCRLTGIDGHPITEVASRFKAIIQSGNPSFFETRFLKCINNPVLLKGLQLTGSINEATFEFTTTKGKIIKRLLRSVSGGDVAVLPLAEFPGRPLSRKEKNNYWYVYQPETGTLYFSYTNCQDQEGLPFAAFNEELFAAMERNKPRRLVVDLRYNSGGNSGVLKPFIERIKTSGLNTKGKLFVLIGKETFSSALMNAVELKRNTNAILVGEPTSGTVNHYGEVRGFRLPHSKIVIAYSTRYWETWKGYEGPLRPDIPIVYSVKNYARGIDEGWANGNLQEK